MQKRFILVLITFLGVLAGLFIYQKITVPPSSNETTGPIAPPPPLPTTKGTTEDIKEIEISEVGVIQTESPRFEYRDQKGRITREFGFKKRLGGSEGIFKISEPWVKIHSQDNRIIKISAETGSVPLETEGGQIQMPESGYLEQVLIQMYHIPGPVFSSEQPEQAKLTRETTAEIAEITVQLEGQVEFQVEFSRLESRGQFIVTSTTFNAVGRGLSLIYDQVNERLQELELRQIEKLIMPAESIELSQTKAAKTNEKKSRSGAADDKKNVASEIATYRLTLSDEVIIDQGSEKLAADDIEILAQVDYSQFKQQDSLFGAASQQSGTGEKGEPIPNAPASGHKQAETPASAPLKNIVLTCKGPLHIAIDEKNELGPSGEQLRFTATGKPARIWRDGELAVEADEIRYEKFQRQIRLSSVSQRPVRLLMGSNQWASAAGGVIIDQIQARAGLLGPGQLEYAEPQSGQTSHIDYQDQVQVEFASGTKADGASSILWGQIQQLTFTGRLNAKNEDGRVQADKGRLEFYPPTQSRAEQKSPEKTDVTRLKSLELVGNVQAEGKDSRFSAEQLNAAFAPVEKGPSPLQHLIAQGNVRAEDPNYIIEAGQQLRLTFDVKASSPNKQRATDSSGDTGKNSGNWGFDQLLKQSKLKSAWAEGPDGKVRFTVKDDKYQIVGDRVEGDATQNIWTIYGNKAQVIGLARQGLLEGDAITANLKEGLCCIPGPGALEISIKSSLLETVPSRPSLMQITWQDSATYSIKQQNITLHHVNARIEQTDKTHRITELACPILTVFLDQNPDKKKTSGSESGPISLNKLKEFQAQGPLVRVAARELDLETDRIIRNMHLHSQELRYDDVAGSFVAQGPGWIELINYRPDRPKEKTREKSSLDMTVSNLFGDEGPTRSLIQFGGQFQFHRDRNQLSFSGQVALDHLPLTAELLQEPTLVILIPGVRRLDCEYLQLTFARNRVDQADSTSAQIPDLTAVERMEARGEIFAETVGPQAREHFFAGDSLVYDIKTDMLVIQGKRSMPAYFDLEPFSMVQWNRRSGQIIAIPAATGAIDTSF